MTDSVHSVFDRLDAWRHLPAYQLERRADVFFSLYLAEVVGAKLGVAFDPRMVPELPIKKMENNQSEKLDYALFSWDRRRVVLVELKTDMRSRNDAQDAYLQRATEMGAEELLHGVLGVAAASTQHGKYAHLLDLLVALGVMRRREVAPNARRRFMGTRASDVEVVPTQATVEVVYVQPVADAGHVSIGFDTFADHVARHDDALSQRFAQSLRAWVTPAGA